MEHVAFIVVGISTALAGLVAAYWQWVYKPRQERGDTQDPGDRALDELFEEKRRLQRAIDRERDAHSVTRTEYVNVVQRLAIVETQLEAARQDIVERDEMLARLRMELFAVREDIADIRRGNAKQA
jgi:hypothetical protein